MKLTNHMNSINFAENLSAVNNLLENAEGQVSFFGKRIVKIDGYRGSIALDDLARKIMHTGHERSHANDLTPAERVAGIEISNRVKNLYEQSDSAVKNANWFTRLINLIREFTIIPYTPRFHVDHGTLEQNFRGYTQEAAQEQFGYNEEQDRAASPRDRISDGWFRSSAMDSARVLIRKEHILAQAGVC